MKILIYTILSSLILTSKLLAQQGNYILPNKVLYNFTFKNKSKPLTLLFNDTISFSITNSSLDSVYENNKVNPSLNKIGKEKVSLYIEDRDLIGNMVYRNIPTKIINQRIAEMPPFDSKLIIDDWITMNWETIDSSKTILGYKCNMAVTKFRGRKYYVWYSTDINFNFGPWKLYGLSGLIIEAWDDLGDVSFVAKNIELNGNFPIIFPIEWERMSIKKYVDFQDSFHIKIVEKFSEKANEKGMNVTFTNPQSFTTKEEQRNNSLEIKYEWE